MEFPLNARVAVSTLVYYEVYRAEPWFLLLKSAKRDNWEFAGGKLIPPESLSETAARELREETGFDLLPTEVLGVFSNPTADGAAFVFVMFRVNCGRRRIPQLTEEHSEYKWLTPTNLKGYLKEGWLAPRCAAWVAHGIRDNSTNQPTVWHSDVTKNPDYQGEAPTCGMPKSEPIEIHNPGTELDNLLREKGRNWNFRVHGGDIYVMADGNEQLVKHIEVGDDDHAARILNSRALRVGFGVG